MSGVWDGVALWDGARVESVHDLLQPVQCAPRWFDTVDGTGGLKRDVFGV